MEEKLKLLDYFYKVLTGQVDKLPVYEKNEDYKFMRANCDHDLNEALPYEMGMSSDGIHQLIENITKDANTNLHGFMMVRHGYIVAKSYFRPYTPSFLHACHSMSKSVLSLAVGYALTEGRIKLSDPFIKYLPEYEGAIKHKEMRNVTIRHLLTMSSGVSFNELSQSMSNNWTKDFVRSDFVFAPGSDFLYNSLNSYILAVVLRNVTKVSLMEYLNKRLFEPIGIYDAKWELSPEGIEKGGWGLYLSMMDMAKLGQLLLQNGRFLVNGVVEQIVPEKYILEATATQIHQTADMSATGYGYHFWIIPNGFLLNGMFGQNIYVFPKRDLVVVTTAGNNQLFPDSNMTSEIIRFVRTNSNFHKDQRIIASRGDKIKELMNRKDLYQTYYGEKYCAFSTKGQWIYDRVLKKHNYYKEELSNQDWYHLKEIDHMTYQLDEPCGNVLPMMLQVLYQNFEKPIERISFSYDGDMVMKLSSVDDSYQMHLGLNKTVYTKFKINGQIFPVGIISRFLTDEKGNYVLLTRISYLEQSNTRVIKITFISKEEIRVRMFEDPDMDYIYQRIVLDDSFTNLNVPNQKVPELIQLKINKVLEPNGHGLSI